MGMYKYLRELWKNPKENMGESYTNMLNEWRKEGSSVRIKKPTRLDRARSLGYKAKQGVIVVRQRVIRGGKRRPKITGGRRTATRSPRLTLKKNYQFIAEERANLPYPNCEVLNSYFVAKSGRYYWFEVILVDRSHPSILRDKNLNHIARKKGRVYRGLSTTGKHVRGLFNKGFGAEKVRPSKHALYKRKKSRTTKTH